MIQKMVVFVNTNYMIAQDGEQGVTKPVWKMEMVMNVLAEQYPEIVLGNQQ